MGLGLPLALALPLAIAPPCGPLIHPEDQALPVAIAIPVDLGLPLALALPVGGWVVLVLAAKALPGRCP